VTRALLTCAIIRIGSHPCTRKRAGAIAMLGRRAPLGSDSRAAGAIPFVKLYPGSQWGSTLKSLWLGRTRGSLAKAEQSGRVWRAELFEDTRALAGLGHGPGKPAGRGPSGPNDPSLNLIARPARARAT